MSAADAAVADALDRALASLDDLLNGGLRDEPLEAHKFHPARPRSGPNGKPSRNHVVPGRPRRRIAPRRVSHLFITYRSGLMWLALAAVSGLAIGWLATHVG